MPLVDIKPKMPFIPPQPKVVVTEPPKRQSVEVDSKYDPVSNLLTHIEGSTWTVTYYSQVLTKDSPLAGQMVNRAAIYQQYIQVTDMELKVVTPLSTTQDEASKSMKITGSGSIYPFLIPNVGDIFKADIGDGNSGLFRVILSERKSIFKNTIHSIEYILIETSANEQSYSEHIEDLNDKIVDKIIYVRDFLQHGQNPLLQPEEFKVIEELRDFYSNIIERYFKSFVSNEYKTLLVPGQMYPTYDHFLTKSVMSFFTARESNDLRQIRILNVDDDEAMKSTNIWDMLKQKDFKMFKYCFKRAGLVTSMSFTQNPMLEGIYHSGVKMVVYPLDPITNVDHSSYQLCKPVYEDGLVDTLSPIRDLSELIKDNEFQGLTLPDNPVIHKVLVDEYYVLSEAFYQKDRPNMSVLELCVMDYLENKAPNLKAILDICNTIHAFGRLENYYYTPILLLLIRGAVRAT